MYVFCLFNEGALVLVCGKVLLGLCVRLRGDFVAFGFGGLICYSGGFGLVGLLFKVCFRW